MFWKTFSFFFQTRFTKKTITEVFCTCGVRNVHDSRGTNVVRLRLDIRSFSYSACAHDYLGRVTIRQMPRQIVRFVFLKPLRWRFRRDDSIRDRGTGFDRNPSIERFHVTHRRRGGCHGVIQVTLYTQKWSRRVNTVLLYYCRWQHNVDLLIFSNAFRSSVVTLCHGINIIYVRVVYIIYTCLLQSLSYYTYNLWRV